MLIVHLHAFKCAGSTFSWILEKNFPGGVLYIESKNPSERLRWSEAQKVLANKKEVKAVTSHLLESPPTSDPKSYLIVELIRCPVSRYLSAFRFQKKVGQIKSDTSFVQYLQAHRNTIRSNFISRHLSPQSFDMVEGKHKGWRLNTNSIELNRNDLFVGTVERFDESMVLLENLIREQGKSIDLSYPQVQNQTSDDENDKSAFDGISNELLHDLTSEDNSLVARVNKYLDEKIANCDNFGYLLDNYKKRCISLIGDDMVKDVRTPPPAKWKYVH